jgi:hypothetical protein
MAMCRSPKSSLQNRNKSSGGRLTLRSHRLTREAGTSKAHTYSSTIGRKIRQRYAHFSWRGWRVLHDETVSARAPWWSARAPIEAVCLERTQEIQQILLLRIAQAVEVVYHGVGLRAFAGVLLNCLQQSTVCRSCAAVMQEENALADAP